MGSCRKSTICASSSFSSSAPATSWNVTVWEVGMPKRALAFVKFAIPLGPPFARLERKKKTISSTIPPMIYGVAARYHGSLAGR